jgi:MFS superfamily sulfate permease-like transporter
LSTLKGFVGDHPKLAAWFVLAVGMVIILLWSARDVGLLTGQMVALVIATILVAGLCVWIIGWEEDGVQESE